MKKRIALLGSTGSIGVQTLEVVSCFPEHFEVEVLTAHSNAELLIQQAKQFQPNCVVIADETQYQRVKEALWSEDIKVYAGANALCDVVEMSTVDVVVAAIVGVAGLAPVYRAICAGKPIALANKETLVVAGELMTKAAAEKNVPLLPVDSEHSAIFQCLEGERHNKLEKIILTASGGPFRGWTRDKLENVTPEMALKHPNWSMGAKITIDSASMMNKGFEVIEAKWLFDLTPDMIEVQVHPQSIIHSMVQFNDGAVKAQLGTPDMRIPISLALSYPERIYLGGERLDFGKVKQLTFEAPDPKVFRNLALAYEALDKKGNVACVVNAANEVVVREFLNKKIGFLQMSDIIEQTMAKIAYIAQPTYEDYIQTDIEARKVAESFIK